jgi:transcriptional regulator
MIVSDFTVPELDRFREQCNFVGNEIQVFELRSQGIPLERIAEYLNMSVTHTSRISQKVNNKIKKIL